METTALLGIIGALITALGTVWMWALNRKDSAQADQIAALFALHKDDAKELQEHKLRIAEGHYNKSELDGRFAKIEDAIKDGFKEMGSKFDALSLALVNHMSSEERRKTPRGDHVS